MNATKKKSFQHNWRLFDEARAYVRNLGLKNVNDWVRWAKSSERPDDIPAYPNELFRGKGWVNWSDWLGTKHRSSFRPFDEARAYVHNFGLQSRSDWRAWLKNGARPMDIPTNPNAIYKDDGWIGWGDWLGTNRIAVFNRVYRPFLEARIFVHMVGLRNQTEWIAWAKSNERPDDIPADPRGVYKDKGWVSMGDWLGTGYIANQNKIYRPFEEARAFAQNLGLKNVGEWNQWRKTSKRPADIPANPQTAYKDKGWVSWGDWLGTRHRKISYRPFEEAHEFVRKLGLQDQADWKAWAKSNARPDDIPANPQSTYKNKGWVDMGDWLGTGYIASQNRVYRPFKEAHDFARSLNLKNQEEWREWSKRGKRPSDVPATPSGVYKNKGWTNWGDWLGTNNKKGGFLEFEQARKYAHSLELQKVEEWIIWSKSKIRPDYIPVDPSSTYKNAGWSGWGDWLGTGRIAYQNILYRPFHQARTFARKLGLNNKDDWNIWAKSDLRPDDIPADPASGYRDKGWLGWGDWLGIVNLWNKNAVLGFLYSIQPVLQDLRPTELYAIMRQNGMITSLRQVTKSSQLIKSIRDLCSSSEPETDFEKLITEIEKQNQILDETIEDETEIEIIPSEERDNEELPALRSLSALKAVDALVEAGITSDAETIEFLVANRVSGLWQDVLNKDLTTELENLRNDSGGVYFNTIRQRFLTQYDGAQSLDIPADYDFRVEGKLAQPNLMQRLAAYRILTEKRLGNWSGVGAGKTLSAILASRVIDTRLTIIIAFNSTLQPWAMRIKEAFPDSVVHIKERGDVRVDPSKHTYLVLNFETFQQPDSVAMVQNLVDKHKIDFVVLDEIQSVKQRTPKVTSKRRQVVSGLLSAASEKNPDLCVLGMSATPVINNLYEAKALLELVKGVEFNNLNTFSSIANASAMHEKLILYGIRYRPEYKQTIETEFKEIAGNEYLPRLRKVRKGAILDLEKILLDVKLETIISSLRKGTLIYTHYLTGLVSPLRHAIEKAGFKVGLFTGEDKSGLELFKKGKVDVLIGSVPVGTGVDGLQYVCNRMIVVSLPWTSAEYEQLIGRLYRQGSAFAKVEVILPQVVLEHDGDIWSWDKMRMHRIQYKKTLADAALDGVIPQGELTSPEMMFKRAREALQAWIARVENEGVTFIERSQLRVPLPKETAQIVQRRFGDLSMMNSRFNTAYSKTTHDRLKDNPEEWYLYHTLYREARKTWEEIPFEKIAKSLKKRPDWVIGDFGCGEAKLAEILPNKVHSFDHVAINEKVTACDITQTPLKDDVLDVAVFSLSLMGLNYAQYLKEAYRTLRFGGMLKIAEPINRWPAKMEELLSNIVKAGFLLIGEVSESNQFLYIDAIKIEV